MDYFPNHSHQFALVMKDLNKIQEEIQKLREDNLSNKVIDLDDRLFEIQMLVFKYMDKIDVGCEEQPNFVLKIWEGVWLIDVNFKKYATEILKLYIWKKQ